MEDYAYWDIRESVRTKLVGMKKAPVELLWELGSVYSKKTYKEWGFSSFGDWVAKDYPELISPAYAYVLAKTGAAALGQKDAVQAKIDAGDVSVKDLREAASASVQTGGDFLGFLENKELRTNADKEDPEKSARITLYLPQAELDAFYAFFIKRCLYKKVKTINDCIRDDYASSEVDLIPERYKKFLPIIDAGKYFCAVCNDIPVDPNLHHILKVSLGHGYGPQALVCADCHIETIHGRASGKDRHKIWCKRFGFDFDRLRREAEEYIELKEKGEPVPPMPTEVITGRFLNVRI